MPTSTSSSCPAPTTRPSRPSWACEAITEAHHVTGRYDYLLAGHFADLQGVDTLLGELKRDGLVAGSETRFVLRSVEGVDVDG